ncbi:uncharacterized protein LOC103523915 [Nephila pilipes]|uniref:Uncharacterized protein LOC103523915 n=1 Tax=Nephila pilipes TaxID=299642 RepID=A0A8X6NJP6_NEPPI|nr:uncharacterized protein LOC103523915 [Nephila pilipes]GFT66948.1 uncharacterized protein LOC103523915 [Nephila pilipes]
MLNYNMDLSNNSRDKYWENTENDWKEFSHRTHKEVVANFRLKTRHNCLAEYRKRIDILINSLCPISETDTMNREYLFVCSGFDPILQPRDDVCLLLWSSRDHMS